MSVLNILNHPGSFMVFLLFLWRFSIFVKYYFQISFNLTVSLSMVNIIQNTVTVILQVSFNTAQIKPPPTPHAPSGLWFRGSLLRRSLKLFSSYGENPLNDMSAGAGLRPHSPRIAALYIERSFGLFRTSLCGGERYRGQILNKPNLT